MTSSHEQIIALLNKLPLKEAVNSQFSSQVRSFFDIKSREWYNSAEYKEECRLQRIESEERRKAKVAKENAMEKWALENVKPGMLVRMTGTRDTHGLRQVISVSGGQIVCRKLIYCGPRVPSSGRYSGGDVVQIGRGYWIVTYDTTSHGAGKLKEVLDENTYKVLPSAGA